MKRYNIGVDGISGFIAQVDTSLVLSSWFEFNEEREYIIKFHEYCLYMMQHGRSGHESAPYSRMFKMIQLLEKGELKVSREDLYSLVADTYCDMMYDVGIMLIKSGALLHGNDVRWKRFNIVISLPKKLIDAIGTGVYTEAENGDLFYDVLALPKFDEAVRSKHLLNMLQGREDFCLQDILKVRGSEYEDIIVSGIMYMTMSKNRIKCRIGDD